MLLHPPDPTRVCVSVRERCGGKKKTRAGKSGGVFVWSLSLLSVCVSLLLPFSYSLSLSHGLEFHAALSCRLSLSLSLSLDVSLAQSCLSLSLWLALSLEDRVLVSSLSQCKSLLKTYQGGGY
jgi:hypothetical protein